jgi:hypothetical protein
MISMSLYFWALLFATCLCCKAMVTDYAIVVDGGSTGSRG